MEFINDKIWKPVHLLPGFECCIEYYINDHGEVKSTKGKIERILKVRVGKSGYATVNLTQRIGRRGTLTTTVHKLVALAFLDQPLASPGKNKGCSRVRHIDGCKTNNAASNLKWTKIEESNNLK
tara:strand:- start:1894 stop:2265 length:372 start_codon:yes stop_codon:yes gene_type:complete